MSSATFKIDLERTEIAKGAGAAVQTAGKDYVLLPHRSIILSLPLVFSAYSVT